ncbi:MAG TPA: glycosyltransferase [Actinomycetota bacterium]|nr:glycosyltransferase [Actinomycetota bacterium]
MHSPEVHQFLPVLAPRDAVGNITRFTHKALKQAGYGGGIWAEEIHGPTAQEASEYHRYKSLKSARKGRNLLLYRASTGSKHGMVEFLLARREPKLIWHHNITPAHFFTSYDSNAAEVARKGRDELARLSAEVSVALADSDFNANELHELGVETVHVVPPFIPPEVEPSRPHSEWIRRTKKGVDVLFVGRVVPQKGHFQLMKAMAAMKAGVDSGARLFVVGAWGPRGYMRSLFEARRRLRLESVAFTGSCSAEVLASFFQESDVFLSMSEHEGFGVPLVEAMRARLPVVARDQGAVGETLGNAGIKLKSADPLLAAEIVGRVAADEKFRSSLVDRQVERAEEIMRFPRAEAILAAVTEGLHAGVSAA